MGKWIWILTLAFVVGIGVWAYAAVENVKVSGDLTIRGITRKNMDLTGATGDSMDITGGTSRDEGSWLMTTTRVRVDADLSDNVATTVRFLDERDWDPGTTTSDNIEVDLAYVTLRELFDTPLTLKAGRQELHFGSGMIIADPDSILYCDGFTAGVSWGKITAMDLSARKAFDAVRATLDYAPWVIDTFYAKISEGTTNLHDDVDLYGVNSRYDFGMNEAIGELYLFVKDTGGSANTTSNKSKRIYNLGGRTSVGPSETFPFILSAEVAHQFGTIAANSKLLYLNPGYVYHDAGHRDAWATRLWATMLLPPRETPSSLTLGYEYFSGDNKTDGKCTAWDPMYYDMASIFDAAFFDPSNSHILTALGTYQITPDLDVALRYSHYMVAKKYPADSITVAIYGTYTQTGKRHLGDVVDLDLNYTLTEDVSFGLNSCLIIPGEVLDNSNDSKAYQVIGKMIWVF